MYESAPEYRAERQREARQGYRERASVKAPSDPRKHLSELEGFSSVAILRLSGRRAKVMRTGQLAAALDRDPTVVYRYIARGLLPAPILETHETKWQVYSLPEVRAIAKVLGRHFERFSYYRSNHTETTKEMFEEVEKVRKIL
jgi:hypothetical protein